MHYNTALKQGIKTMRYGTVRQRITTIAIENQTFKIFDIFFAQLSLRNSLYTNLCTQLSLRNISNITTLTQRLKPIP